MSRDGCGHVAGTRCRGGVLLVPGRRGGPVCWSTVQLRSGMSSVTGRFDSTLPVPWPLRPVRRHRRRRRAMWWWRSRLLQRLCHATHRLQRTARNTNQVRRTMWSVGQSDYHHSDLFSFSLLSAILDRFGLDFVMVFSIIFIDDSIACGHSGFRRFSRWTFDTIKSIIISGRFVIMYRWE